MPTKTKDKKTKIKAKSDVKELIFNDTSEIEVPTKMIDQVIGQDASINLIKKVAGQKRHIMLIGAPGTGKSMIASALAEMLPTNKLTDILVYPNLEILTHLKLLKFLLEKERKLSKQQK